MAADVAADVALVVGTEGGSSRRKGEGGRGSEALGLTVMVLGEKGRKRLDVVVTLADGSRIDFDGADCEIEELR